MHQLAVVGNPIAHSLSPVIFTEFGKQTGIDLNYERIFAPIDDFEHIVADFFASGGYALNVTAPFKSRAFAMANQHRPLTLLPQTANVLINSDSGLIADNTDGKGLVADLAYKGIDLTNRNILIIGSGSVISSVLPSLELTKPSRIDLLMRDWDKFEAFALKSALVSEFCSEISYDVVINTTPNIPENSLFDKVTNLALQGYGYDMGYTHANTLFMNKLSQLNPGAKVFNGLGMLIQQAKYGFNEMFGVLPEVDSLYPLLTGILHG